MTDAFGNGSFEVFIEVFVVKNILFYVFSLFINDWATKNGPIRVFDTLGAWQIVIAFFSVPLYVFGKKNRA